MLLVKDVFFKLKSINLRKNLALKNKAALNFDRIDEIILLVSFQNNDENILKTSIHFKEKLEEEGKTVFMLICDDKNFHWEEDKQKIMVNENKFTLTGEIADENLFKIMHREIGMFIYVGDALTPLASYLLLKARAKFHIAISAESNSMFDISFLFKSTTELLQNINTCLGYLKNNFRQTTMPKQTQKT